jgi:hypothetical protein
MCLRSRAKSNTVAWWLATGKQTRQLMQLELSTKHHPSTVAIHIQTFITSLQVLEIRIHVPSASPSTITHSTSALTLQLFAYQSQCFTLATVGYNAFETKRQVLCQKIAFKSPCSTTFAKFYMIEPIEEGFLASYNQLSTLVVADGTVHAALFLLSHCLCGDNLGQSLESRSLEPYVKLVLVDYA